MPRNGRVLARPGVGVNLGARRALLARPDHVSAMVGRARYAHTGGVGLWEALEGAGSPILGAAVTGSSSPAKKYCTGTVRFVRYKHFVRAQCVHVSRAYACGTCSMGARRVKLGAAVVLHC